eukprot:6849579-Prymnesium_polylepis.1
MPPLMPPLMPRLMPPLMPPLMLPLMLPLTLPSIAAPMAGAPPTPARRVPPLGGGAAAAGAPTPSRAAESRKASMQRPGITWAARSERRAWVRNRAPTVRISRALWRARGDP